MLVKILGLKISLEIIILMLVIYLVMIVHALASCCNSRAIAEGFSEMMKNKKQPSPPSKDKDKTANSGTKRTFVENIII